MQVKREICPQDAAENKFYSYPAHKVLGVFEKPESVKETIEVLKKNGFNEADIEVICNAGQIDFSGEESGLWGRIVRSFQRMGAEGRYLDRYEQELENGNLLVIVAANGEEAKQKVKTILQKHSGHRLTYFGNWTIEGMPEAHDIIFDQHPYGIRREVGTSFNETIERIRKALQKEGFGILVSFDMKDTLKERLGVDFRKYAVLGSCNPTLAYSALQEDLEIGLLLPCNVIVYESNGGSVVAAIDAGKMLSVAENPKLVSIAETVNQKLKRAIETL